MLSRRADWSVPTTALTLARERAVRAGRELIDLTVSNPTTASLPYPLDEIADALARGARAPYDPQPLGLPVAREAVAAMLGVDASDIVITASTSEAYSFLFKLLGDPGDRIATATPTYPLLEHLAQLEQLQLTHFPLELHRRWEVAEDKVAAAVDDRTRAIVIVNPNNPTGSYVSAAEQDAIAHHGIAIISDEVFFEYAIEPPQRMTRLLRHDVLSFSLGGLSKAAGLPHLKLGWIVVSGPARERREALAALEMIADNFLSVSTPVQHALPSLLALAPRIRSAIIDRTSCNLAALRAAAAGISSATLLPVEGGWMAVLRVPSVATDEALAIELVERAGVIVHPGYFYDFDRDGFLAVSLLTPPGEFDRGVAALLSRIPR